MLYIDVKIENKRLLIELSSMDDEGMKTYIASDYISLRELKIALERIKLTSFEEKDIMS